MSVSTPKPENPETMEAQLAADLVPYGYTMEAFPDPDEKYWRRIAITSPGKLGRCCTYETREPAAIRAAHRVLVEAAQAGLPKDA